MFSLSVKVRSHHTGVNSLTAALLTGFISCLAQTYMKHKWMPRLVCTSESPVKDLGAI